MEEGSHFQEIKKPLQNEEKELKGVALGLCQWKENLYSIITEYGYQTRKRFASESYDNIMTFYKRDTEELLKLPN